MKKTLVSIVTAGLVMLAGGAASAQDGPPRIIPVDILACTYNDGKGPADLDAAVDAWSAWVDESDNPDAYAAWTMTKHYAGDEQDFDFAWLGAWRDGEVMGESYDAWYSGAGEIMAGFAAVADCGAASNFGSIRHRAPKNGTPSDGVLVFSDCTRAEGVSNATLGGLMKQWAAVLDDADIDAGIFHWYPIFGGGGDPGFHFKAVTVFPSHAELGKMYQGMTNGGMYQTRDAIFGDAVDCDVARVYNAENRRSANVRGD